MPVSLQQNYRNFPEAFHEVISPEQASSPRLIAFNHELAEFLQLDLAETDDKELAGYFSGNERLPGSEPVAAAYAGHQFGHFVPQLGDGRAHLLGEVQTTNGRLYDLQLKGSGRTRFSRGGDGLSALGPVLREYIVSEAMFHLGVPTTRALAAVLTGDTVYRDEPLPGAVFTRVADSHLRVGTFEYFASRRDVENLRRLLAFSIDRHYPKLQGQSDQPLQFLRAVIERQVELIASWIQFGFIHGVMNTDNTSIAGITIDYGPCAFIDEFRFDKVFSSIDRHGRYAFMNQPVIGRWNMTRLAETLALLMDGDERSIEAALMGELERFPVLFEQRFLEKMLQKFGISDVDTTAPEADRALVQSFLQYLEANELDFTRSFQDLASLLQNEHAETHLKQTAALTEFMQQYRDRLDQAGVSQKNAAEIMGRTNPVFIPRNHQVERAIDHALNDDYSVFFDLVELLREPFSEQPQYADYKQPPTEAERVTATFCGT